MTARWVAAAAAVLYAAIVVVTIAHHEPWRDEVVPLSMARDADTLPDLAAALAFEGHPLLWYGLLRGAHAAVGEAWVLKALNAAFAVGAVSLWLLRAPLPLWLRCLFAFSTIPLYQYGVVSRSYALGMLLVFAFCALHPRRREHPLAVALVLAALANTHAPGFLIACAAGLSLAVDAALRARGDGAAGPAGPAVSRPRLAAALAVYAAGLVLAAAVALPDPSHTGTGVRELDAAAVAAGIARAAVWPAGHSQGFFVLPGPSLWLWAFFAYLARRPALLCFAAASLVSMEAFFTLVHAPATWHLGNALLAVVATAWLDAAEPRPPAAGRFRRAERGLRAALAGALGVVLAIHAWFAALQVRADLAGPYSSSRALSERIAAEPELADAVLVGEPDGPVTSLAYYLDQRIYLPREGVFRRWGVAAPTRRRDYDLAALLADARGVRERCGCPVVIALGRDLSGEPLQRSHAGTRYEETFRVTPEAAREFREATRPLGSFRDARASDENYDVYVLP